MPALDGAVLGSIGRKQVSFALACKNGRMRPETIRHYAADAITSVSGALSTFQHDLSLPRLPSRSALAAAGLARGDVISITRTRLYLSKAGLHAMLGEAPVLLNDFAAQAWALFEADSRPQEVFAGDAGFSMQRPGTYCVLGITSGLGAAILKRGEDGQITVLPTEAGHAGFVPPTEEWVRLVGQMFPGAGPIVNEDVISAPGLLALYTMLADGAGTLARAQTPEEVTRSIASDRVARQACELLAQAFWACAGNLVLSFGAWDGIVVTGGLAGAIRAVLGDPAMAPLFAGTGKHQRLLVKVPRVLVTQEHGELLGAAAALLHHAGEGKAAQAA